MTEGAATALAGVRRCVGDLTLNVVEAGPEEGPLVILLHGFPEFWWGWRRQIDPLAAAGFRVVAPDQRGYHLSDKPKDVGAYHLDRLAGDVLGLAKAYGRDKVRLVGHDWGGLVAWWTAALWPGQVERLIVLNAPHPAVARPYMLRHPGQMLRSSYVGFFQLPWLPEAVMRFGGHALLRQGLHGSSRPGTFSRRDLERYEEAWSQPGALEAMLDWYRALPQLTTAGRDLTIRPESLIIWGVQDRFLQRGLAEASLQLCRSGRIQWIEATHWVHLEEWRAVNAALVAFLREVPHATRS